MGKKDSPNRTTCGILAILLGAYGVHKFVMGQSTAGVITLCVTFLTCGLGALVMYPIGVIEGIMYLTKSDDDFYQTYIVEKKAWF